MRIGIVVNHLVTLSSSMMILFPMRFNYTFDIYLPTDSAEEPELFNAHSKSRLQVTDNVLSTAQSINASKAKKIHFDALTAELDYRARLGELVETKQVEKEAFEMAKIVRDKLTQIADRLAPVVTGQKKESYVFKKIEVEINRVLKLLSD